MAQSAQGDAGAGTGLSVLERAAILSSLVVASFFIIDPIVYEALRNLGAGAYSFFRSLTHIGRTNWILIPSGIAILALMWLRARESGFRGRVAKGFLQQILCFIFAATALSGLSASFLKNVIGRARPKLYDSHGPVEFQPMTFDADFASFPSGHAATAGAIAAILSILFPRWRVFFFVGFAWIASTRFFIGAHYVSDVVAGFAFGAVFVYVLRNRLARRRWLFRMQPDGEIIMRGRVLLTSAGKALLARAKSLNPVRFAVPGSDSEPRQ